MEPGLSSAQASCDAVVLTDSAGFIVSQNNLAIAATLQVK
jgi:hypothetical protein